jgi:hypothetical protein
MYLEIGRMIWIASDGSRGVRWIAKIGIRFLAQSDQNQLVGPLRCSPFHLHRTANYYFPGIIFLALLIRRLPKSPNFQPVTPLDAILLLDPQIKSICSSVLPLPASILHITPPRCNASSNPRRDLRLHLEWLRRRQACRPDVGSRGQRILLAVLFPHDRPCLHPPIRGNPPNYLQSEHGCGSSHHVWARLCISRCKCNKLYQPYP